MEATENPFLSGLQQSREALLKVVSSPRVLTIMASLPDDSDERLAAIRELTPEKLLGDDAPRGYRVAARWFESDNPDIEYYQVPQPQLEPDVGGGPGTSGRHTTVCNSAGWFVCHSAGS